jgi:hypothetical protein
LRLPRQTEVIEQVLWSNHGPVIVSESAKTASGSHPCRVFSVSYEQVLGCHGRGREFESRRPRHFKSMAYKPCLLRRGCGRALISAARKGVVQPG